MAGDLVKDPTTPQTMVHDLESFYWVLLWICLVYMKTSKKIRERSSIVKETMCPRVYAGTGGDAKINYLAHQAAVGGFDVLGKPGLTMLVKRFHLALGKWYREVLPESELSPLTTSHAPDTTQSTTRQVSHESLFAYLEQALHPEYWADA